MSFPIITDVPRCFFVIETHQIMFIKGSWLKILCIVLATNYHINYAYQMREFISNQLSRKNIIGNHSLSGPPSCETASTKHSWSSCVHLKRCLDANVELLRFLPPLPGITAFPLISPRWSWTIRLLGIKLSLDAGFGWYICHICQETWKTQIMSSIKHLSSNLERCIQ